MLCLKQETEERKGLEINWQAINSRIGRLDALEGNTKYARQKSRLQVQFEDFLGSLTPLRTLASCTPDDLRYFLVWKDDQGRTKVHTMDCQYRGCKAKCRCECPAYMAAGTLDSLIGKLRAILRDAGRGSDWDLALGCGNPAAAPSIKTHLKAVRREQAEALVTPRQAEPLMFDKVIKMSRFLSYKLKARLLDDNARYLLLRDRAYFTLICQLGDRAGDLGLVQAAQVSVSDDRVVVEETQGKCLSGRKKPCKRTVLYRMQDTLICPVANMTSYKEGAMACGVDLSNGYFFRVLDKKTKPQQVVNQPVTSGTMSGRLKTHLSEIGIWQNETSHSARVGCSVTLALLGVREEDIRAHVGWDTKGMVEHYTRGATATRQRRVASTLAEAATSGPSSSSKLVDVAKEFRDTA